MIKVLFGVNITEQTKVTMARKSKEGITITFSPSVESHVGMQILGEPDMPGYTKEELVYIQKTFEANDMDTELLEFVYPGKGVWPKDGTAHVLIVRNFVDMMTEERELLEELLSLQWDTKAMMRKRVVNKHARYNLCFTDESQKCNFEKGEGTVVSFSKLPLLSVIRNALPEYLGPKAEGLYAEGNLYHDVTKTGIGFHGDGERRMVIAIRLGEEIPLRYLWFHNCEPVGDYIDVDVGRGDLYIMSEKAAGTDWKRRIVPTIRHAAGCKKYTVHKKKPEP